MLLVDVDGWLVVFEEEGQSTDKLLVGAGMFEHSFCQILTILLAIFAYQHVELLERRLNSNLFIPSE